MLKETYPLYLANQALQPNSDLEVHNKFNGEIATRVARANQDIIDEAIGWAVKAAEPMRKLPSYKRAEILH